MYVRAIIAVAFGIALAVNHLWIPAGAFIVVAVMVVILSNLNGRDRMG